MGGRQAFIPYDKMVQTMKVVFLAKAFLTICNPRPKSQTLCLHLRRKVSFFLSRCPFAWERGSFVMTATATKVHLLGHWCQGNSVEGTIVFSIVLEELE